MVMVIVMMETDAGLIRGWSLLIVRDWHGDCDDDGD